MATPNTCVYKKSRDDQYHLTYNDERTSYQTSKALYDVIDHEFKIAEQKKDSGYRIGDILSDIAAAWFVYSCAEISLLPGYKKYRLFCKAEHSGERITGSFIGFSEKQRYEKMNCVLAEFSCDGERRKIFIAENSFEGLFREGIEFTLTVADNIAVLCEVAD